MVAPCSVEKVHEALPLPYRARRKNRVDAPARYSGCRDRRVCSHCMVSVIAILSSPIETLSFSNRQRRTPWMLSAPAAAAPECGRHSQGRFPPQRVLSPSISFLQPLGCVDGRQSACVYADRGRQESLSSFRRDRWQNDGE